MRRWCKAQAFVRISALVVPARHPHHDIVRVYFDDESFLAARVDVDSVSGSQHGVSFFKEEDQSGRRFARRGVTQAAVSLKA